ncbi:uncharacterized protein [Aegilops tauschii subsp. strangulata]|uniref:uncharacterized protein isoform X1 n=1 Tax=Aegilops tauschii subsp. strangulata TaxID=200361 RepID=UPI00098A8548|nr:uncharacterized protein LOC109781068 isoform X1 [Aegilops tauschii subsp. strangulata]
MTANSEVGVIEFHTREAASLRSTTREQSIDALRFWLVQEKRDDITNENLQDEWMLHGREGKSMNATWATEPAKSGYGCATELLILCCYTMLACMYGVFTPHLLAPSGVRLQCNNYQNYYQCASKAFGLLL